MSRSAFPVAVYAVLLGVLAAVMWPWDAYVLPRVLLTVAAAAMGALAGLWALQSRRLARTADASELRAVPDISAATALLGFAIPTLLVGSYLGLYLVLIGGGVTVLACGGLVREALAVRRATARAGREVDAP